MSNSIIPIHTYREPSLFFYDVKGFINGNGIYDNKYSSRVLAERIWAYLNKDRTTKFKKGVYIIREKIMHISLGLNYEEWIWIQDCLLGLDIPFQRFFSVEEVCIKDVPFNDKYITLLGKKIILRKPLLILLQKTHPDHRVTKELDFLFSELENGSCDDWKEYVTKKTAELTSLDVNNYLDYFNADFEDKRKAYLAMFDDKEDNKL